MLVVRKSTKLLMVSTSAASGLQCNSKFFLSYLHFSHEGAFRVRIFRRLNPEQRWCNGILTCTASVLQPEPVRLSEARTGIRVPVPLGPDPPFQGPIFSAQGYMGFTKQIPACLVFQAFYTEVYLVLFIITFIILFGKIGKHLGPFLLWQFNPMADCAITVIRRIENKYPITIKVMVAKKEPHYFNWIVL